MFRHTGLDDLGYLVSMESGLEDRNNLYILEWHWLHHKVSMESGLEDRNNQVRQVHVMVDPPYVSMESGLEDRNNRASSETPGPRGPCLNGVRPRRPEQ